MKQATPRLLQAERDKLHNQSSAIAKGEATWVSAVESTHIQGIDLVWHEDRIRKQRNTHGAADLEGGGKSRARVSTLCIM